MHELSRLKREVARAGINLLDSVRMGTTPKARTEKKKTIWRLNLERRAPQKRLPFDDWNVSSPEKGPLLSTETPSLPF
ncbi:hypothetical protein E1B28_006826 [Marasmius oreades]|uniref:Uncharacterized protein n=1 Tax=Marasmius oreades TaxID=181124 RepID=A0A9P7UWZ1_9AGAR|nr:uncharacterized protein E1B28_006826 [Marasmius oreades]KAG7096153.1 hypothetical protein E1B28_006826 [Marasmius oreades]